VTNALISQPNGFGTSNVEWGPVKGDKWCQGSHNRHYFVFLGTNDVNWWYFVCVYFAIKVCWWYFVGEYNKGLLRCIFLHGYKWLTPKYIQKFSSSIVRNRIIISLVYLQNY
jgi:hypothetical protein